MKSGRLLIIILIAAALLRFYKLESFPVSIYPDEAAIGYSAYSIAQTGKDENGLSHPFLFKSFNDYKLPGYIYLDALFIKLLGLNVFSTRLPSALFGTLAPVAIYLIAKKLLDYKTAIAAAFMFAISPWSIQLSRAAFEANVAFTIVLFGIVFLLQGLKSKMSAILSIPTLILSTYFYHSTRIIVPLLIFIFFAIYFKESVRNLRFYLFGFLLALLISIPAVLNAVSIEGLKHVSEVSIFEDKTPAAVYAQANLYNQNILSRIFLNHRMPYVFESMHNYFSHFSPGFLFFGDDANARHHAAFHGNLYLFEMPLLLIGLWKLLSKNTKARNFLILFLIISPIPAAFSKEAPHTLRTLHMLLPLTILSAMGLVHLLKNRKSQIVIPITVTLFFINYLFSYLILSPVRDSRAWGYGYEQMYSFLSKTDSGYDRVIVTGYYWKPYIYYLFYNKVDPKMYQKNPNTESIGKYRFGSTFWDSGGKNLDDVAIDKLKAGKTLVVLSKQELQELNDKNRFKQLESVNDYSKQNSLFLIGRWE